MSVLPVFRGKDYRLILVLPASGHRDARGDNRGDGQDTGTHYLLAIPGMGVAYGLVHSMRKFERQARQALDVRRLEIERRYVSADKGDGWISVWHALTWDLLEQLEKSYVCEPKAMRRSLDAWTDYPLEGIDEADALAPVRACKVISYSRGNGGRCEIEVDGISGIHVVKQGYLYKKPGRLGEVPLLPALELFSLNRPQRRLDTRAA